MLKNQDSSDLLESNSKKIQSYILLLIGIISLKKNDFDTAKDYLQRSLLVIKELGDDNLLAECYLSLGDAYIVSDDKKIALHYFKSAITLFEIISITDKMFALNHIAVWLGFAGEITLSIQYFEKSLSEALQHNDRKIQATAFHGLGWNHQTKGNFE